MKVPPLGSEGAARALNALDATRLAEAAQRAQDLQLAAADIACKMCEKIVEKLQDGPAGTRRAVLSADEIKHLQEMRRKKLELQRATLGDNAVNAPAQSGEEQKRQQPQQHPKNTPSRSGPLDTLA